MNNYREAQSLVVLREQINSLCPFRDKTSDGWIGDAPHAKRNSDHNPWVMDGKTGIVTAQDIDADLNSHVLKLSDFVKAIAQSRDPRVKYIIWAGMITRKGSELQEFIAYHGADNHRGHAHISVFPEKRLYDSTKLWQMPNLLGH